MVSDEADAGDSRAMTDAVDHQAVKDCELMVETILKAPSLVALETIHKMHTSANDPLAIGVLLARCPATHVELFCHAVLQCLPVPDAAAAPIATASDVVVAASLCGFALRNCAKDGGSFAPGAAVLELSSRVAELCARIGGCGGAGASASAGSTLTAVLRALEPLLETEETSLNATLAPTLLPLVLSAATRGPARQADIKRLLGARRLFGALDLKRDGPHSALRVQVLKSACEAVLLRSNDGRKLVATLLTLQSLRAGLFDALFNSLAFCRKSHAQHIGTVFLLSLRLKGTERFRASLINITEKAVVAPSEPLASNLRCVLNVFHAAKSQHAALGMDALLHRVYTPVVFSNLLVANPYVRRNAAYILSDAYPVHDPAANRIQVEETIHIQIDRLAALLVDPVPFVRVAAVEGTCGLLARMYEIVPPVKARAMIEVLATTDAFDRTTAAVRAAAVEGFQKMLSNTQLRPVLVSVLPKLCNLVYDSSERVRIAILSLLLQVRKVALMKFVDIVPMSSLLFRLEDDSPPVIALIMRLIIDSYFPTQAQQDEGDGPLRRQMHACHALIRENSNAARTFYRHLYMYQQPKHLLELAINISQEAMNGPKAIGKEKQSTKQQQSRPKTTGTRTTKRRRARADADVSDATVPDTNSAVLLEIAADVQQTLAPALAKGSNRKLRQYIEKMYDAKKLLPYMTQSTQYGIRFRIAAWRVASVLKPASAKPLLKTLCLEIESFVSHDGLLARTDNNAVAYLGALAQCCIAWDSFDTLATALESWCYCLESSAGGKPTTSTNPKGRRRRKARGDADIAVDALIAVSDAITMNPELQRQFLKLLCRESKNLDGDESEHLPPAPPPPTHRLIRSMRLGSQAAVENALTNDNASRSRRVALIALTAAWRVLCLSAAECPTSEVTAHIDQALTWASGDTLFDSESGRLLRNPPVLAAILAHVADAFLVVQPSNHALNALENFLTKVELAVSTDADTDADAVQLIGPEVSALAHALSDIETCTKAENRTPKPNADDNGQGRTQLITRVKESVERVARKFKYIVQRKQPNGVHDVDARDDEQDAAPKLNPQEEQANVEEGRNLQPMDGFC